MHEFSLAQGLVNQLLALAGQHNARKICTVRVEIGSLAGIVGDSFAFGFEVLSRENELLQNATACQFGRQTLASVQVQLEQLRLRLDGFAEKQAERAG